MTSISSMNADNINRFAMPPRPPRKSSRSGSKERPGSRNGSQGKPVAKPGINAANMLQNATSQPVINSNTMQNTMQNTNANMNIIGNQGRT